MKRVYADIVGDIFHRGHVEFLKKAKNIQNDVILIIGVHSDYDCEIYKRKPISSMDDRITVIQACKYVDEIIPNAPLEITKDFLDDNKIDYVIHGDDWNIFHKTVNYKVPVEMGIMKIVPYYNGVSTSKIIDRIYDWRKEIRKISNLSEKKWRLIKSKYFRSTNFDREARKFNLFEVKNILDKHRVFFWITDGTLLGAYRDKDFIKWDNEVDIDVFDEDMVVNFDKLVEVFINRDFIVRKVKRRRGSKINLFKNNSKVSIRALYLDTKYKKNKFRLSPLYCYPKKFFRKFEKIKLGGTEYNVPSPIKKYLMYVFGPSWNIPIKSKKKVLKDLKKRKVKKPYKIK